jgi:MarR family transcriptional repressor of emrRAB
LQLRDKLLALRRDALTAVLKRVSLDDLAPLERIAEILVATLPENALSALTTCRYCDERSCIENPRQFNRGGLKLLFSQKRQHLKKRLQ